MIPSYGTLQALHNLFDIVKAGTHGRDPVRHLGRVNCQAADGIFLWLLRKLRDSRSYCPSPLLCDIRVRFNVSLHAC